MKQSTLNVCILGSEAVGKTSFLAGLMVLGEPNRASRFTVKGENAETQRFLYDRHKELVECRQFPPSTSATESLLISVTYENRRILINVIEFPGEVFRAAANLGQLSSMGTYHKQLLDADVLLLMIDPSIDGQNTNDLAPPDAHLVQDRQRALLDPLIESCNRNSECPEVGIIVTKADRYPEAFQSAGAEQLLKVKLPHLIDRIDAELPTTPKFFAATSVGNVEEDVFADGRHCFRPAIKIEPRGYEELFQWIINRKAARRFAPYRRWLVHVGMVSIVLLVILVLAVFVIRDSNATRLADRNVPNQELYKIPRAGFFAPSAHDFAARAKQDLDDVENRLKNRPTREELRSSIIPMFADLKILAKDTPQEERSLALERDAKNRLEELWSRDLMERGLPPEPSYDEYERDVREFVAEFPESSHVQELQVRLKNAVQQIIQRHHSAIAAIRAGDLPGQQAVFLRRKADAINKYLSSPHCELQAAQKSNVQRAVHLAGVLADGGKFWVKCPSLGPLADERRTTVEIRSRKSMQADWVTLAAWENNDPSTTQHWDDEHAIDWQPGEALQVRIIIYRWKTNPLYLVASSGYVWLPNNQAPIFAALGLKLLCGSRKLSDGEISGSWKDTVNGAALTMELRTGTHDHETISSDDWALLEKYFDPGDAW